MSVRYRNLFVRFVRSTISFKANPIIFARLPQQKIGSVPCAVGFSLFTWLGFYKKTSAEDELIHTIKHCVLFIQRYDYIKAEQLLHVALRQAQQMQHQLAITYIYDVMANLALEREHLDKAKDLFVAVTQRIMADGATEDDFRVVHISTKLARISHLKKDYQTAQMGYEWCLEKLEKIIKSDPSEEKMKLFALAEDWYGRLFLDTNQYEHALKLMTDSLEKMQSVSDIEKEHIATQMNDIGTVCDLLGKTDESLHYFKEAIEIGKKLEMELGTMYVNLGRAYIKKKILSEARKNCGLALKIGVMSKNKDVKEEAENCFQEIKRLN